MNGSENGYAGAIFFALISLGAFFTLDDVISWVVGAASALFAAVSLRQALVKAAQAAEEDHQRMEIQLQQLRSKIMETSSASVEAMTTVTETAHLLQENLQVIRVRLAELDNLTQLTKDTGAINRAVASLEENSFALNAELEKIVIALQTTPELVEGLNVLNETGSRIVDAVQTQEQTPPELVQELKSLNETGKASEANLQMALKLLQVIGQMMKTPTYAKDLDALKIAVDKAHKELSELVRINGGLSKNFSTTIDDLRIDVARLTARRETTRNTPQIEESQPVLNEHDITMLKRIVAKINIK